MKILVIGGAGYIGSHFIIEASKLGHDLTVLDDLSSGFKDNLDKSIPFYKGSTLVLKDLYKVMELKKFDVVVHLAAFKAAGAWLLFATEAWAAVAASCCESALRPDFLFKNNARGC